ncbi:hypothetical protein JTB14_011339 [Gonioctena quinquepunctata]|nr:hypothetical protein JTB14_011339 [Gonioctena quinquepunctata]
MDNRLVFVVSLFFCCTVGGVNLGKVEGATTPSAIAEKVENATRVAATDFSNRKGRAPNFVYAELVSCAVRYDTACLVDVAGDYLDVKRQELLGKLLKSISSVIILKRGSRNKYYLK